MAHWLPEDPREPDGLDPEPLAGELAGAAALVGAGAGAEVGATTAGAGEVNGQKTT